MKGDDPADTRTLIYRQLPEEFCRFVNTLKALDAQRGDQGDNLPVDDP